MFTLKIKFPSVSEYNYGEVREECERLKRADWLVRENLGNGKIAVTIFREIRELFFVQVHWNQRFLGLEPTEISVTFENSLLPIPAKSQPGDKRFLDTLGKWKRFESNLFQGFWYEVFADSRNKILEVRVSDDQHTGGENSMRFLWILSSIHAATSVARHLHQFRMAAGKQNVPEMDRHYNEILEAIDDLPR
ncbi:MAG: hypothetical protein HYX20_01410 [Candidatus Yanofskybacteria bacterium]|nr:hypothetical protein [Candidatus Yanofskybacteria bacterium]